MDVDLTATLNIYATLRGAGLDPKTIDHIVDSTDLKPQEKAVLHTLNGRGIGSNLADKNIPTSELRVPGSKYTPETYYNNGNNPGYN